MILNDSKWFWTWLPQTLDAPKSPIPLFQARALELRMSESEAKSFRPSRAVPCMPRMLRTPVPWWQLSTDQKYCWHLLAVLNGINFRFKSMYTIPQNPSIEPIIPIRWGLWHFFSVIFRGLGRWDLLSCVSLRGPGGRFRVGDKVLLGTWNFGLWGLCTETYWNYDPWGVVPQVPEVPWQRLWFASLGSSESIFSKGTFWVAFVQGSTTAEVWTRRW